MKSLCSLLLFAALAQLRPEWESLVEAERSFARTSLAQGIKPAFLSVLAEDSVIFRPQAVAGKKWFQENPGSPAQLSWAPEFADISAAGDLGYTTGPWEVRRTPQEAPGGFGHYVTLWRRPATGEWKVVIDIGIGHAQSPKPAKVDSPTLPLGVAPRQTSAAVERVRQSIAALDQATAAPSTKFAADVRLYRDGNFPLIGQKAALTHLAGSAGAVAMSQSGAFISESADLGYTYGTAGNANYLHIWKKQRDGSWKIVLDLLNPLPKQ